MLEKKEKIKTSELLTLLTWLKGETVVTNKKFRFDFLLTECNQSTDGEVDVEGFFDDLMFDLFGIYDKLKTTNPEELEQKMVQSPLFNILPKDMVEQSMRSLSAFIELYEKFITECKFEFAEIRGIQKNMMSAMITKYIMNEEFEKCIDLKAKLKDV